jgi:dipeptidyl aminopeptidase/acylaminoacyl peptidase
MRRSLWSGLCAALVLTCALAKEPAADTGGLPPLLDRTLFFGDPEISNGQISPDGRYVSFLKPWNGTRNIYVKSIDEPFSAARLLTTERKRPIPAYLWSWDSKYILYTKDHDGDENFNAYAVDPSAKPAARGLAPASRDLTGLKGVRVVLYAVPRADPDILYIGINDRDKAWHDLYRLQLSTGKRTLIATNTERIVGWTFDLQGRLRLGVRSAENGGFELLRVGEHGFSKIYSCSVLEVCFPVRFQKGDRRLYIATNKGADVNLISLALLDPETGQSETVESDPLHKVDLFGTEFSEVTDELLLTVYYDARERRSFHDQEFECDFHWLQQQLPDLEIRLTSTTRDEQKWLIAANSDTEPGQILLFDRRKHILTPQYRIREELPRTALASMMPIEYESSDGLAIPAYLTLPKAVPAKNLPAIIVPHGGPESRYRWGYDGLAQFLANRGYAVLLPNFRGSTGYGKKFLDAGNLEWGRKMQDDVTWGVKSLIAQGIADPKRVGIMGGSYGGYAVLVGVAFTPDLYAAAVDEWGPSNLITLQASMPPYWEAVRKVIQARMGDPGTPTGKALLSARSPIHAADKIRTPLLIAQGANDPRVARRESEQIVIALRDRGFPVEYYLAPDEGHGFARPINNLAIHMAEEKFLAEHLGGRYQAGGSPEEVARLKEITVDPKSVVLAK